MMIVSDTDEMIGLSHSGLNYESTNWIFGNKIWIYQLLTKHRAKQGLVIIEHHSFDMDLHRVTDFRSNRWNISNTRSIRRSSMVVLILFCSLWIFLTFEFLYKITQLLFFFFYDVLFTFLIFIVKSEDFSLFYLLY